MLSRLFETPDECFFKCFSPIEKHFVFLELHYEFFYWELLLQWQSDPNN